MRCVCAFLLDPHLLTVLFYRWNSVHMLNFITCPHCYCFHLLAGQLDWLIAYSATVCVPLLCNVNALKISDYTSAYGAQESTLESLSRLAACEWTIREKYTHYFNNTKLLIRHCFHKHASNACSSLIITQLKFSIFWNDLLFSRAPFSASTRFNITSMPLTMHFVCFHFIWANERVYGLVLYLPSFQ